VPPSTGDIDPKLRLNLLFLLAAIALWGMLDLSLDDGSWLSFHVFVELTFIALLLGAVAFLWRDWLMAHKDLQEAERRVRTSQADRDVWRERTTHVLGTLGAEIDAQFERWSLTRAERDVALLLLKGLGHKEAAAQLGRSERTVRQHAVSLYRKSGLGGRAELAAFFLEDLLLPAETLQLARDDSLTSS